MLRAAVSAGASALDADASCLVSGDVIVKVYYSKPTQAVGALRWLHSPEVKAQWSDAGDVVQVLGELDTPKGYCVVFSQLQVLQSVSGPSGCPTIGLGETVQRVWSLLERLHTLGVAHGDVHAGNVALSATGRVGLLDFDECSLSSVVAGCVGVRVPASATEPNIYDEAWLRYAKHDHASLAALAERMGVEWSRTFENCCAQRCGVSVV